MTRYFVEVTLETGETQIMEVSECVYRMVTGQDKPAPWFKPENRFGKNTKVRALTYKEARERGAYNHLGLY